MKRTLITLASLCLLATSTMSAAENRETQVRNDKTKVEAGGLWIYNDLPQATAEASRTRKPMLVVFRCVP